MPASTPWSSAPGTRRRTALLSLAELAEVVPGTRLAWAVRSSVLTRVFGGGDADALPAARATRLGAEMLRDSGRMEFVGGLRIGEVVRTGTTLTVRGLDTEDGP